MNLYEAYLLCEEFIEKDLIKRLLKNNINNPNCFIKSLLSYGVAFKNQELDIRGFTVTDPTKMYDEFANLVLSIDSSKSEEYYRQLWGDFLNTTNIPKYKNNIGIKNIAKQNVLNKGVY